MPSTSRIARLTASAMLAFGLTGCLSGQEGFYGSDGEAPDVALVKTLMRSVGAIDPKEEPIAYQPRAPLAMPASQNELPAPEATAENGAVPPNWPRDKDGELAAIQDANTSAERQRFRQGKLGGERTPIQEVQRGTVVGATAPRTGKLDNSRFEVDHKLSIHEMQSQKLNKPDTARLFDENGQPRRSYLIEPPVEYSTPAASAPLPTSDSIEVGADKRHKDAIEDYDPVRDR